jgi:hypothetical protein
MAATLAEIPERLAATDIHISTLPRTSRDDRQVFNLENYLI